jgi:hypothetical protein
LFPRSVLREEEEWGGGTGAAYYSSDDLRSVDQWWGEIETAAPKFPLYATFLATRADYQTVSFIEAHRPELKEIAGANCCFVYFRDYNAAQRLEQWDYSEHARVVVPMASLIGVTLEQLPCLVFFRRFTAGEFWRVDLRNLPSAELMARMRRIFSLICPDAEDPLRALKHYDWLSVCQRTRDVLKDAFKEVAQKSPETYIDLQRVLGGHFYSCFISYSTQDGAFAKRLHSDLVDRKLRCWFAPKDLKPGEPFQERIEESILAFDKLMIVLSKASVHSRWVEREVNAALEREDREKRPILFPIRIDDAVMEAPQPWVAYIRRTRHIGDFRGWEEHDYYQEAFDRLLRDLKAPDQSTGQPA